MRSRQLLLSVSLLASWASAATIKIGEWNVYYAALDDQYGRRALVNAIDAQGNFDFFTVIEAQGDSPQGRLEAWSNASRSLRSMQFVSGSSRFERIAIFYDAARWTSSHTVNGSFEVGRPWLLSKFESTRTGEEAIWVMAVHLPHFLAAPGVPGTSDIGAISVAALKAAGASPTDAMIFSGDFNEFQWEDNPCMQPIYPKDCRAQAKKRMSALWDTYLRGSARDLITNHTLTCSRNGRSKTGSVPTTRSGDSSTTTSSPALRH